MINFFGILLSASFDVLQTALTKGSSQKINIKQMLSFNLVKSIASLFVILLLSGFTLSFHMQTVLFGGIYGILLFVSLCCGYLALLSGNMAITSILVSYSVLIPVLFGGFFLKEPFGVLRIVGLILLFVSITTMNTAKQTQKTKKHWGLYTLLTFIGNGFCSVVQKLHQTLYPKQFCTEFMTVAFVVILLLLLLFLLIGYGSFERGSYRFAAGAGACVGAGYSLTLFLSAVFPAAVLFPTLAISGAILNCLTSKILFKEKLKPMQLLAIAIGVCSVICLQL